MEELKKCPFCGGEATLSKSQFGSYVVICKTPFCVIKGKHANYTKDEAIKAWNRRSK